MYVFVLLVQSADNFNFNFYVHQMLAQKVGTDILIIKRPSGRNWRPWQDRFPPSHPPSYLPLLLLALIVSELQLPEHPLLSKLGVGLTFTLRAKILI